MDACMTIYPARFGVSIIPSRDANTAEHRAADWLFRWRKGEITHKAVEINAVAIEHDGYSPIGLKTFDDQRARSSGFSTGNVMSNVQTSTFVDSYHHVEWPAKEKGEFQSYGLNIIKATRAVGAEQIAEFIRKEPSVNNPDAPHHQAIAYLLHHYTGPAHDRKRIDHGWVVTDSTGQLLKRLDLSNSQTSQLIMDRATDIFTHKHTLVAPLLKIVDNEVVFVDPKIEKMADAMAAMAQETTASIVGDLGDLSAEEARPRMR